MNVWMRMSYGEIERDGMMRDSSLDVLIAPSDCDETDTPFDLVVDRLLVRED